MKPPLEKEIQNAICEYLVYKKVFFWRSNNIPVFHKGSFRPLPKYTPKGLPDIMCIVDGRFIGLEVKRPKGQGIKGISPWQAEIGVKIVENGGIYKVVHSLDEVAQLFESLI